MAGLTMVCLAFFLLMAPASFATNDAFSVSPLIVDEKAKQRDIIKQTVVLTNNTDRKRQIYVTVKNMDRTEGEKDLLHRTKADINTSIANWIEITRGVIELEPGETKRIPYLIQVHLSATPGIYHAKIYFQEGSNRAEAERRTKPYQEIDVNLEVLDDATERLQLSSFISNEVFFTGKEVGFSYLLENIGNRAVAPEGEIRIYNRRGEEVATLPANNENVSLLPEATSELAAVWQTGGKFGRYKAFLDLQYGEKQVATVNDTVFFWVIPWKQIVILFVIFCIVIALIGYIIYERYDIGQKKLAPEYAFDTDDEADVSTETPEITQQKIVRQNRPVQIASQVSVQSRKEKTAQTKPHAVTEVKAVQQRKVSTHTSSSHAVRLNARPKMNPTATPVSLKKRS
jgi:hypothetical protein